jgi:hypothetical protein
MRKIPGRACSISQLAVALLYISSQATWYARSVRHWWR